MPEQHMLLHIVVFLHINYYAKALCLDKQGMLSNSPKLETSNLFQSGPGPEVIKLFLILNSTEHEISTAH